MVNKKKLNYEKKSFLFETDLSVSLIKFRGTCFSLVNKGQWGKIVK